ncbi:hypothetical protein [Ureibacillus sp. FSL K6-0786]|uniref:hypothetical protein n=1 Tax=Ureibacillus sp. FSL K6-0786 TaxID=2954607 RepID=UPI0030D6DFA2
MIALVLCKKQKKAPPTTLAVPVRKIYILLNVSIINNCSHFPEEYVIKGETDGPLTRLIYIDYFD